MVAFVILTCKKREGLGLVEGLSEALPGALVYKDEKMYGSTYGHYQSWKLGVSVGADWIVVVEDDAILCSGFQGLAEARVLEAKGYGHHLVSFFSPRLLKEEQDRKLMYEHWYPTKVRNFSGHPVCYGLSSFLAKRCINIVKEEWDEVVGWYRTRSRELGLRATPGWVIRTGAGRKVPLYLEAEPNLVQHNVSIPSTVGVPEHRRVLYVSSSFKA